MCYNHLRTFLHKLVNIINKECVFSDGGSTSSEWEVDWESADESSNEATGGTNKHCKNKCKKSPKKCSGSSSDAELEKCPICLLSFRQQQVANPSSCEHCFCLDCLVEWSKNINTCPVDRQTFNLIHVRAKIGGKVSHVASSSR